MNKLSPGIVKRCVYLWNSGEGLNEILAAINADGTYTVPDDTGKGNHVIGTAEVQAALESAGIEVA